MKNKGMIAAVVVTLAFLIFGFFYPTGGPQGYKERVVYYKVNDDDACKFYYKGDWYYSLTKNDEWYYGNGNRVRSGYGVVALVLIDERELKSAYNSLRLDYLNTETGRALVDGAPINVEKQ